MAPPYFKGGGFVAWKRRYSDGWFTVLPRYWRATREEAERLAHRFGYQMSIVDMAVLPDGESPPAGRIIREEF